MATAGLISFTWNGDQIVDQIKAKAEAGTNSFAILVGRTAKMIVVVRTGTLMRSIKLSVDGAEDGDYGGADWSGAADIRRGGSEADLLDESVGGEWQGDVFVIQVGSWLWYAQTIDLRDQFMSGAYEMVASEWGSMIGDSRLSGRRMGVG